MNYFVTGIGTNVGKTIVSAVLVEALKADYWKPIQSGTIEGRDSETVKSLISNAKTIIHPERYLLKEPLSPHYAAKLESIEIELDEINLPKTSNHLIVEGAGGLLVPINSKYYVIDIAKKFECEIVLVISNYLGCINHSLLSIDYLVNHGYKIHSLILNGHFENEVKSSITKYHPNVKVVEVPNFSSIDKVSLSNVAACIEF
jgi:dethiobiotin synthetase